MTCQSLVSLSIEPPLVLFCPARSSSTWPRIARLTRFGLNVLAVDQRALGRAFARTGVDKFEGIEWRRDDRGAPIIEGALAYVFADVETVHEGGDHLIVVGRVVAAELGRRDDPLPYCRGSFALSGARV
jgi:3-hydroxy-9,10-secoandrosta-1,3,5(10)-triene-9,17-dione monooxygenase reductase component